MIVKRLVKFFGIFIFFIIWVFSGWLQIPGASFPPKPEKTYAAIAQIGSSESHTSTGSSNEDSFSWTHSPGGTPRGVLVFVNTLSATKTVTSVTYGGVSMNEITEATALDSVAEPGRIDTFFLGTSIPTGDQTIVINRTNNSNVMYASVATMSGSSDTEVYISGIVTFDNDGTFSEQLVNDGYPESDSVRYADSYYGGNSPAPAGSNSTLLESIDFGANGFSMVNETVAGQGPRSVGFNQGTKDDRAGVHLAVREIAPIIEQNNYRFFENSNNTDVGNSLATQNTAIALSNAGDPFRLRQLLRITNMNLSGSGKTFKLQFSEKNGTCDGAFSGESYTDITGATIISYNNNSSPSDGDSLTANANDPVNGGDTVVNQTYEESNNFTNSVSSITTGQVGKWDFSLKDNGAVPSYEYCVRVVYSNGNPIDTYSVMPEVKTAQPTPSPVVYEESTATAVLAGTSVAYPASVASGDLLVLVVGQKPNTANGGGVNTPQGWTAISGGSITGAGGYGNTLGGDTGNTNIFSFYRVADGTETGNLFLTYKNYNVAWAQIYRLTNSTNDWSISGTTGEDTTGNSPASVAMTSDPGVQSGDLIIGAMSIPTDVTTPSQFSAESFSQTGVTFGAVSEISEMDSTNNWDIGGFAIRATVTSGTSSANPTMTATVGGTKTNVRGPGVFIRTRATGTITWQTPGAISYTPNDNTNNDGPEYPSSISAGDLLTLVVGQKPSKANEGSVGTPNGWTAVPNGMLSGAGGYGSTLGADTGNTNLYSFYKVATGTENGNLDIYLDQNNVTWTKMSRFSNNTGEWDVEGTTGEDAVGDDSVSISMSEDPGTEVDDVFISAMVIPTDVGGGDQFSSQYITQNGAKFMYPEEVSDIYHSQNNDIGGFVAVSRKLIDGPGSSNPTLLATAGGTVSNVRGPGAIIRIRQMNSNEPQSLSFSLSDNSIGFGALSSLSTRYATGDTLGSDTEVSAHSFTASTNADSGYIVTMRGPTLTSSGDTISAIGSSSTTPSIGTEQFGVRFVASGGNGVVLSPYNSISEYAYAADINTTSDVAQDTDGDNIPTTYSGYYIGNIAPQTEAGDYNTTITYIITAGF